MYTGNRSLLSLLSPPFPEKGPLHPFLTLFLPVNNNQGVSTMSTFHLQW